MAPPINPNSYMSRVVAACQEPRTVEQIAQAIGENIRTTRLAVWNLISRRRLLNLRAGRRGVDGLYVVNDGRHAPPAVAKVAPCRIPWDARELESAWRQPA